MTLSNSHLPIPTRYDNILFASRSEAYTAVLFDVCSGLTHKVNGDTFQFYYSWQYLPDLVNRYGWQPDFKLFETIYDVNKSRTLTNLFIVEAKSMPELDKYEVAALKEKFAMLFEDYSDYVKHSGAMSLILSISFYLRTGRIGSLYMDGNRPFEYCPLVDPVNIERAARYRFDNN